MKKLLLVVPLIVVFGLLSAQHKVLIDNIHGADFVGDSGGEFQSIIDFSSLFSDDEVTILTPDSLPFDEILVHETVSGLGSKTYDIDLPDGYYPEMPICLYCFAKSPNEDFWKRATGYIKNPAGEIVSEFFEGSSHVENALGIGWEVYFDLEADQSYEIKIGYGVPLFSCDGIEGKYSLSDYNIVIRIRDNTYWAILGNTTMYQNFDLWALSEAFTQGLSFINTDNYCNSMADKPFIHFYSDKNISADISIEFPGRFTLLSNNPKIVPDKNNRVTKSNWSSHKIVQNDSNEIIYEGSLNNKLNFLEFDFEQGLSIKNRIPFSLDDFFIFKYEGTDLYRITEIKEILPFENIQPDNWEYLNTEQVTDRIKTAFYKKGIEEGLTAKEIDHLVNDFQWVEGLLYRSGISRDDYFGFYHFGKEVYDKLIGFNCEPYPGELNRTMWVMLSFIRERESEAAVDLNMAASKNDLKNGLKVNEYGVVDEYYTNNYFESENDLFGINIYDYREYWTVNNLLFYDNEKSNAISSGSEPLGVSMGVYCYEYSDYLTMGILYPDGNYGYYPANELNPSAYGKIINDYGQLLVLGTSSLFKNSDTAGNLFLNSSVSQMVDNSIFTGIDESSYLVGDCDLRAYPNPFNPSTVIEFKLDIDFFTRLSIYNYLGQEVKVILNKKLSKGQYKFNFNADDLSSGIYFCKLVNDGITAAETKILFLK